MSERQMVSPEESLARVYKDMKKTMTFFVVGWIIFMFGSLLVSEPGNMFLILLGAAICAGPVVAILFTGASFAGLFKADYEVITTYSDGSKKSDGGAESRSNNMMMALILAIIAIFVGIIVQLIRFCIQTGKYYYYNSKVSQKPDFLHSGTFIIVIGFAVLIGAPTVFGTIKSVKEAAARAAVKAAVNAPLKGQTAKVIGDVNLRAEANGQSAVVKTLTNNSTLTMTGENVNFWVPVEQDGSKGYVFGLNLIRRHKDTEVSAWKVGDEFNATLTEQVNATTYTGSKNITLEKGTQVKVYAVNDPYLSYGTTYNFGSISFSIDPKIAVAQGLEEYDTSWMLQWEDWEKLQYVGPVK